MFQLKRIKAVEKKVMKDIRFNMNKVSQITFTAHFDGSTESFDCFIVLYQPTDSKTLYDPNYPTPSKIGEWRVRDFFEWDKNNRRRIHLTSLYSDLFFNELVGQLSPLLNKELEIFTDDKLA